MRFFLFLTLLVLCHRNAEASGRRPSPHFTPGPDRNHDVLSVKKFARHYGFDDIDRLEDRLVLKGEVHEVELYHGSRRSIVNGTLVWLNEPLLQHNRTWVLTERDIRNTLVPLLRPTEVLRDAGYQVVVLDPGHGGEDSGAVSPTGLMEKDVVLDVSRRVRALLQKKGVKVFLTRHDDRFLDLDERPRRADRWEVDLFVSIHANAGSRSAQGVETFVLSLPGSLSTNQDPDSPAPTSTYPGNAQNEANVALAYALHHSLRGLPETIDRGVKRARFSVLRSASAPAALIEMGFLSHPVEGKRFHDPDHRERVARSLARGIDNYLRAVKRAAIDPEFETEEN